VTTSIHQMRIDAVLGELDRVGARHVLDLGCGDGDMLVRLAGMPQVARITGLDLSLSALDRLRARLQGDEPRPGVRIDLIHGSMTDALGHLGQPDAAVLLESIEHVEPHDLSKVERELFIVLRPRHIVMTTPNADYNPLLGVPAHRFRHPEHCFEWGRYRFRRWATGVAERNGYLVVHTDIAGWSPRLGGASQMAVFTRNDGPNPERLRDRQSA
jgi:SAM-dependent methyltransferase